MDRGKQSFVDPLGVVIMLSHIIASEVELFEPCPFVPPQADPDRRGRILTALGLSNSRVSRRHGNVRVNEKTLARYYDYLAARLELPFPVYYPPPSKSALSAGKTSANRCEVVELLDPRIDLCDEIDGLYCRTRNGDFLVNLPLVELTVLPSSKNVELLSDYEYWFWHWREV